MTNDGKQVTNAAVVLGTDGTSKGYGFVSFRSSKSASQAVQMGLGVPLDGQLNVDEILQSKMRILPLKNEFLCLKGRHVAVKYSKQGQWRGKTQMHARFHPYIHASD